MKRRIATFESFKYNENLEHGDEAERQDIKIYDADQYEEFVDYVDELASRHQVEIHWGLVEEEYWDIYVKENRKFAVILTNEKDMGKHFIGALLDEDGEVIMSTYNNDTPCPKEVAEGYLNDMQLYYKEDNSWESNEEVCSNCNCDCNKCECDNCDCSNDWKESENMKFEYNNYMNEKKKATASYKKSKLKNPEKADLNKDKKISGYEKARGKAIQKSVQDEKEEKGAKGLTAKQKKLPEGLRKAIEKRMKGKK